MKTLLLNGSKVLVVVAALGFLTVTLVSIAPPARADQWVAGCNAFWYPSTYTRGNCVRATTGTKNYTNHTQVLGRLGRDVQAGPRSRYGEEDRGVG